MTSNQKLLIGLLLVLLLIQPTILSHAKDKMEVNLSTPNSSIDSYFHAYKICDFELRKKVVEDSIEMIGEDSFFSICRNFKSYKILKEGVANSAADIWIKVRIEWQDQGKYSIMFYDLKNINGNWIITSWNAEEGPEDNLSVDEVFKSIKNYEDE